MGGVGVDPVGLARGDDLDRRLVHPRITDLHRAGVGAQQQTVATGILTFDIEGVVHRTRRVILGRVQRGEVVEIFFDLRAVGHIETDRAEDRLDPLDGQRDRVQPATAGAPPGQRHVDRLLGETRIKLGLGELRLTRAQQRFDRLLDLVELLADPRALLGRQFAQGFHALGDQAVLAEKAGLGVGQRCRVSGGDRRARFVDDVLEGCVHRLVSGWKSMK